MKRRAHSMVLTSSLSFGSGVYSSALETEKSQSLPFPVDGGVVVTNDWCIILNSNTTLSFFPLNLMETSPCAN